VLHSLFLKRCVDKNNDIYMATCAHCGCAMVAEIQKGKYIYYHCTGNRGKCPEKYTREEVIDQQYSESLRRIELDNEVVEWIVKVMNSSTAEEREQKQAQAEALNLQKQRIEARLEKMYLDRLDGLLVEDEYKKLSNKFRNDLSDIKSSIDRINAQNEANIIDARRILELAQKAATLYSAQIPEEKRKLLSTVCSNSNWGSGELTANFNQPFDMIAITNDEYKEKKATFPEKNDLFEIWRPRDDESDNWEISLNFSKLN